MHTNNSNIQYTRIYFKTFHHHSN